MTSGNHGLLTDKKEEILISHHITYLSFSWKYFGTFDSMLNDTLFVLKNRWTTKLVTLGRNFENSSLQMVKKLIL